MYADDILKVLNPLEKTIIHIPSVNSRESTKDKLREVDHILEELGEFDGLDEFCDHYLATINELPIGTARIREEKKGALKIERMAVLKEHRKKGVGKAIIKEILKHYLNLNQVNNLTLNSQIEAKDFYKKFGFVEVGEEFVEANIIHQKMIYNV